MCVFCERLMAELWLADKWMQRYKHLVLKSDFEAVLDQVSTTVLGVLLGGIQCCSISGWQVGRVFRAIHETRGM